MGRRFLKQKGVQRTGTTICAKMVEQAFGLSNFARNPKKSPNKHSLLENGELTSEMKLLINIKDPYSWLVSWHAWSRQANHSGKKLPKRKKPVKLNRNDTSHAIKLFNESYRSWLAAPCEFVVIRYEDLLRNPSAVYKKVAALLGEQPDKKKQWTRTPDHVIRPARTKEKGLRILPFNRAYYMNKEYLDLLKPRHLTQLANEIDWELFKGLYTPIS